MRVSYGFAQHIFTSRYFSLIYVPLLENAEIYILYVTLRSVCEIGLLVIRLKRNLNTKMTVFSSKQLNLHLTNKRHH